MINKTKKFQALILKINSKLNEIVSEINNNSKKQALFSYSITIKVNQDSKVLNFYINEKLIPSNEIKIPVSNYFNDLLKELNEILNKIHFFNCHIRMSVSDEKTNEIFLEIIS